MALETTDNRKEYAGNGVTLAFAFPYYFLADTDLVVIKRNDTTGVETPQVITTNYTVTGEGDEAGGTVTMLVAPAAGNTLIIYRDPDIIQEKDFRENDSFPAEQAEEAWDRAAMISQRLAERADRKVGVSDGFVVGDFDLNLPVDLNVDSAGKVIIVNEDEDGFEMGPTADDIANAQGYASDAADSAAAALASEVLASEWATKTDDLVGAVDNSAKAYAIGGTGGGQPTGGDAKSWAQKTSAAVIVGFYSAKEWATGILTRGLASGGSAKDWATYTGGTVDNTEYSAKKYAADSAASAASAAAQLASAFFRDVVYITSADSPRVITSADNGKLFNINSSGGAVVFTLPAIAGLTLPFNIGFKLTTAGNNVTLNRSSTDTIEGATSLVLATAGQGANLVADTDGSPDNWSVIAVPGTVLPIANGGTGAATASANLVFAGPASGAAAAPSFRALVPADRGIALTAVQTTTYAILTTDNIVLVSGASGAFTATLPTAVGVTGKQYQIKRTDQTLANQITLATTSSQTIDGVTTRKLCTQNEEWTVVSDGANWIVLSHTYPQTVTQYTPATTAFGTPSSVEVCWQRVGNCAVITGALTIGTATASDASVGLPSGLAAAAAPLVPTAGAIVGTCSTNTLDGGSNISCFFSTVFPSGTAVFFGIRYSSFAPLTKQSGSGLGTGNNMLLGTIRVPIAGWDG